MPEVGFIEWLHIGPMLTPSAVMVVNGAGYYMTNCM